MPFSPDQMMIRARVLNAWRTGDGSALLDAWNAARAQVEASSDQRWVTVEYECGVLMASHDDSEPYYPRVADIVEPRELSTAYSKDTNS